ncbi:ABC transporter permease [Gordonia sp. LUNF6]|uniref:ABC transporter permease n=1 Tax=Gordonia TaxID=2053 RepID=UPI0005EDD773|nr:MULTISPECIES: ABC transporter permease [Gordonia]KJR06511.1 sodium ABC transporter permease [Gordonia sihwensis]KXT56548.1 sodium ABC transporter permease [Gordonia sp. QH-12]
MNSTLNNIKLVAGREINTRAREKSFIISTGVMMAVIIIGAIVWSALSGGDSVDKVGIVGADAGLSATIESGGDAAGQRIETEVLPNADAARSAVGDGDLAAALIVTGPGAYTAVSKNGMDPTIEGVLRGAVAQRDLSEALSARGVDAASLPQPRFTLDRTQAEKPDEAQRVTVALIGSILLIMTIMMGGLMVAVGVVEEKSSRIVELLLSAVRPLQLLWGKILGIGAISLAQVVLIGATALIAGRATGLLTLTGTATTVFAAVIAWFLLGFLFFAALYAATGAMVSRQEELNSSSAPLTILVLAALYSGTFGIQALDSTLIQTLSWIPPFSAVLMPIRIATGDTDPGQVIGTFAIMVAACLLAVWVASRIYTRSILRTGSRIKWGEVAAMVSGRK